MVCGHCRNCRAGRRHLCIHTSSVGVNRDGAFAEYVVIPETNVWSHPDGMDPDLAAIFDPLGNAVHTALSFPLVGEDVLITGAGPIGLMAAAVARHVGARFVVVTDVNESRLDLAAEDGGRPRDQRRDRAHRRRPAAARHEGGLRHRPRDERVTRPLCPRCSTTSTTARASPCSACRPGRSAIDWAKVVTHMITIKGIYGREMFETWYAMNAMVSTGLDISPSSPTASRPRTGQDAFAAARNGRPRQGHHRLELTEQEERPSTPTFARSSTATSPRSGPPASTSRSASWPRRSPRTCVRAARTS